MAGLPLAYPFGAAPTNALPRQVVEFELHLREPMRTAPPGVKRGRRVVIEVKLAGNAEARRAVVAQVLAYAAVLRGMSAVSLESQTLQKHLQKRGVSTLLEAVEDDDQTGAVDARVFRDGLEVSLATGAF